MDIQYLCCKFVQTTRSIACYLYIWVAKLCPIQLNIILTLNVQNACQKELKIVQIADDGISVLDGS